VAVSIGVPGFIRPQEGLWFTELPALNESPWCLFGTQSQLPLLLKAVQLVCPGKYWLGARLGHQHAGDNSGYRG
jgi:hypothetical protein